MSSYFSKEEFELKGFEKAKAKHKMYNAILVNKKTKREKRIPFGDNRYENFRDITGLDLYPQLIHGDMKRRKAYHERHKKDMKDGYFSAGYFSMKYLW